MNAQMNDLQVDIDEVFVYRDGALYRRTTNKRGYQRPDGYVYVRFCGRSYGEHRLVHALFTGHWPVQVDHINGIRHDNRPENLRSATHAQNCMNRKPLATTKGCYWQVNRNKWMVQIGAGGKRKTIGYFESLDDAKAAYASSARELHGEFSRDHHSTGHHHKAPANTKEG